MDEELGNENTFFKGKDANGNPVYTHNNEVVSKEVFDRRSQASTNQMNAMKNSVTPGIDDDPDIMAMKEKVKAMAASRKPQKKAGGGKINLADCKVNTAKKNSSNSRW
jgi:hypothetical protein